MQTGKSHQNIITDQKIRFGKPTIKGTRIAVTDILALLEAGYRLNEIPEQFQNITLPMAKQAVGYARDVLGKEEVLLLEKHAD